MSKWQTFKELVCQRFNWTRSILAIGATNQELSDFEKEIGIELPQLFNAIYLENNGQSDNTKTILFGMQLMSLKEIIEQIQNGKELMQSLHDSDDMCSSTPENTIKHQYFSPKWIPIFHGGGGSYIGIDFEPDLKGKPGQIINFGIDDEDKFILADSLDEFLDFCIHLLKENKEINENTEYWFYGYTDIYFPHAIAKEKYFKNA